MYTQKEKSGEQSKESNSKLIIQKKNSANQSLKLKDNRPVDVTQRKLQKAIGIGSQVHQLSKENPTIAELNASVKDYKAKELAAKKAVDAQKRHSKAIAAQHKAGNPMTSEEQKAGQESIKTKRIEMASSNKLAKDSRKSSNKMHNTYRSLNPSSANTARFGRGQRSLHQGSGSYPRQ